MPRSPESIPIRRLTARQWLAVGLTLFLGIGLTLAGFSLARELEWDRATAALESKAAEYHNRLQRELDAGIQAAGAVRAFFDSSGHVTQSEFGIFSQQILRYVRGVQALEWLPRVPGSQREAFVRTARREGHPGYEITQRSPQGGMTKAGARGTYYPVLYIEPMKGNEPALGFDAASNPDRLRALERARDSGQMVASEGIKLVQERGQQTGFLVFVPVYLPNVVLDTVRQRRDNLFGFAGGVFRVGAMVEASLKGTSPAGISFTIYDQGQGELRTPLYTHLSRTLKDASRENEEIADSDLCGRCGFYLKVADRRWLVQYEATVGFSARHSTYVPWMVLWGGLLATLLLFFSVLSLVRRGLSLSLANEQLKQDIAGRKRALAEKALLAEVATLLNTAADRGELMHGLLERLQEWSGCEAAGVRLAEDGGFPYYATKGFPPDFVKLENHLCQRDHDGEIRLDENQQPILECMCGNVLRNRFDPSKPFFTKGGSFWSNNTTQLLATTTEQDRLTRTRNRCNGMGYESLALIPMRTGGEILGLIQLNDKRSGRFSEDTVAIVERVANAVAGHLGKLKADEENAKIYRQWQLALEAANLGWWYYDPASKVFYWDDRCGEIFQLSGNHCPEEDIFKLIHPEDLPLILAKMQEALDPGEARPYLVEYRFFLPDGEERWAEAHGMASFAGQGDQRRAVSFAGTVADVTERKLALQTLADSEQRYRLLAENTLDVIWTMNLELEFTYVNNAITKVTGYTPEEWIGTKLTDHCDSEEFSRMAQIISAELAQGPQGSGVFFETTMRDKQGEPFFVEIHGRVLYDDEGRPVSLQGATRDISARKSAEEERQKSDEQFRAAFESAPEGMALIDRERRFFKVNARICEILGYGEEALLGQSFNSFTHPDDRQAGRERWAELFSGEIAVNRAEKRFIHRDGSEIWVVISNAAIKDRQGNTQYVLSHIYDITQRRLMEQALRLSESKFAAAFQHSPLWVAITTLSEGRYLDVNETFLRMTGYTRREVIGRTSRDINLRLDPGERDYMVEMLRREGSVQNLEVKRRLRSGEIREMLLSAELLPTPGEESMVVVLADITELKNTQSAKENLEAQLRQAQKMEAIGTLAGGIAHDFNNILSAILGYAELIQDAVPQGSESRVHIGQILAATDRAKKLVKQILAFGRKAETEARPLDLNRQVRDAVELIRHTIPKMISVELKLAQKLELIDADPGQLEQIVLNLATNAKDAMPEGGRLIFKTSDVYLDEEYCREHFEATPGHYVSLEVTDTGLGMPKEVLSKIFDPFFTTKERGKGTGLGLATIYGIVKAHGGFIYCYSEPGQGTTFRTYFPVSSSRQSWRDEPPVPEEAPPGGRETLLLVDDEEPLRKLGAELLSRKGYKVIQAASGEEALEIYRQRMKEIDLVILDVSMPGMGGHKCLRELVKLYPGIKVLIASGYSPNGLLKDTLASGAAGYIAKPYQRTKMLRIVRDTLDQA